MGTLPVLPTPGSPWHTAPGHRQVDEAKPFTKPLSCSQGVSLAGELAPAPKGVNAASLQAEIPFRYWAARAVH